MIKIHLTGLERVADQIRYQVSVLAYMKMSFKVWADVSFRWATYSGFDPVNLGISDLVKNRVYDQVLEQIKDL